MQVRGLPRREAGIGQRRFHRRAVFRRKAEGLEIGQAPPGLGLVGAQGQRLAIGTDRALRVSGRGQCMAARMPQPGVLRASASAASNAASAASTWPA
jgi:hypothetical protein